MNKSTKGKEMPNQSRTNRDIEERVTLLEYQFGEVLLKKLDRIESKQDAAIRQIDTLKYVGQHEYDQDMKDIEKRFATKDEASSTRKLVYWLMGILSGLVVGGGLAVIGAVIK